MFEILSNSVVLKVLSEIHRNGVTYQFTYKIIPVKNTKNLTITSLKETR